MYAIGQNFEGAYPPEAAQWCNEHGAVMVQVGGGFEIQALSAPTLEDQLAAIESEYAPKIAVLQTAMVAATLTGGSIMDGNISSLRTEWVALLNAKGAAMEALLI